MPRVVQGALIQAKTVPTQGKPLAEIKEEMIEKHWKLVEEAAAKGAQVVCLQEIFFGPYFCAEQNEKWYEMAEPIPGPTVERFQKLAKDKGIVLVLPIYERQMTGVLYNTAAVVDADGTLRGIYRKNHIPQVKGFWEKYYFKPGNLGYPVFDTAVGKVGVYICYDRHFPEGARLLGLNGAEIVFNPSATVAGLSKYLWELEQPAHAVANGYFVGAINRVGEEEWKTGHFYGSSYFCDPRGKILAQAGDSEEAVVVCELDLDLIQEVRHTWQFFRDRRPETYENLARLLP